MPRLISVLICLLWVTELGAQSSFPVDSVVHLRKNTNNNQVHYAVRVDEACRPLRRRPMRSYWLMLEEGPGITERLQLWEIPGYGVRQPREVQQQENGGSFIFSIRGVEARQIRMEVFKQDNSCRARAFTEINGSELLFEHIEIEVSGWANIHKVEIFGIDTEGKQASEVTYLE